MKRLCLMVAILTVSLIATAEPLLEKGSINQQPSSSTQPSTSSQNVISIHYGPHPLQAFDLYLPTLQESNQPVPIIIMVHGGSWKSGDKALPSVLDNKLNYWRAKGYIFASINYRLLPEADPYMQAQDVASAVAKIQSIASTYQGDPNRMIVIGHSAGGHLVALISANPGIAKAEGAQPWSGSIILDSAVLDVTSVMTHKHLRLYDNAFGADPAYWEKVSPTTSITTDAIPMLLVCSLMRDDDSCTQSHAFANKLNEIGKITPINEQNMNHIEINENLGLDNEYTQSVNNYIESLLK